MRKSKTWRLIRVRYISQIEFPPPLNVTFKNARVIRKTGSTFMINERRNRRMLVIMQSCFLPSNCYFYENSFWLFFLLSKFSFKDTGNSRNSKNGGDQLYFSLPLLFGQEHSDIIFATLRIRWLPRISNRIVCDYHTATQWDLKPWFW